MTSKQAAVINSPEEARAKVRWLHKYGAQVIKICATGGVFSQGDAAGAQQLSFEEMKAIVEEAHMLGLKVAAHAHGDEGITRRDPGRDRHDRACQPGRRRDASRSPRRSGPGSTWISTTTTTSSRRHRERHREESLDKEKMIGRLQRETFRKAVRAGVPMLFGTDAGVYPHGDNARQFAKMVEWGMTPMQAIQSATRAPRRRSAGRDVGAIAVGRYGDIVAVDGDPLQDVRVLEHVRGDQGRRSGG